MSGSMYLPESEIVGWGDVSNPDLRIYHDGSNSYIKDTGTGSIITASDSWIYWKNAAADETIIQGGANAQVELYYDDSKKFETTSGGTVTTGALGVTTQATGDPVENDTPTLGFYGAANDSTTSAKIQAKFIGTQSGTTNPTELQFYTKPASLGPGSNPLLALTLDKDKNATFKGAVIADIGGSSSWGAVVFKDASGEDYGINVRTVGTDSANYAYAVYGNSAYQYRVRGNGNVQNTNNSYGAISDVKLKENIVDAQSQWNDIKALKVRNFNFKTNPDKKLLGVVAQEVETISPALVDEEKDIDDNLNDLGTTTKSVKYSVLYMKAIKALQESMIRIETLETKVAALESS
jgi:hypothetical protein